MTFDSRYPYVLLDDQKTGITRFFSEPVDIIQANRPDEINAAFEAIDHYQKTGHYLAGFISYELGYILEPSLRHLWRDEAAPLLTLGVFKSPPTQAPGDLLYTARCPELSLTPSWSLEEYTKRFHKIQTYLRHGDIYQTNLTFPMTGESQASAPELYAAFRRTQPGRYGGIVSLGNAEIISFSPELFFEKTGQFMRMRPMKGTRPRLTDAASDLALLQEMRAEPKSQAENLMIVDLLRNDLSRLCEPGSVKVPELFALETYPTLHQMTSQIEGHLAGHKNWQDIFTGLFPCGSITGAPKIRAMEIIHELESQSRGPYCGSIGYISPDGDACFNVAIRTLQKSGNQIQYGVGSGIVLDSETEDEYQECLLKARILTSTQKGFFETFRWDPETGYCRLDRHKKRFLKAAKAFNVEISSDEIDQLLQRQIFEENQTPHRVRLSYTPLTGLTLEAVPLLDLIQPLKLSLSQYALTAQRQTTNHKVGARDLYDGERKRLQSLTKCDEVLFIDELNNLCEGSFTSLFIQEGGELITPPLPGILPGVLRAELIAEGKAVEGKISLSRLLSADKIYVGNSLRGLILAKLIDTTLH